MNSRNNLTVLASFAIDRLLDKRGLLLCEQKGGPALFLQRVLGEEKIPFDIPYSSTLKVEILVAPKGEFGKVKTKAKPIKVSWRSLNTSAVLISTILDEYDLEGMEAYKNQVFLDVQGYVRDGENFGKKKYWDLSSDSILCVKGTREEISYLPKDFVKKQKQRMLLITFDSKGSILYFENEAISAKPTKIVRAADTIGAGDSFFAYFVAKYLQSSDPRRSLEYATSKTTSFLSSKVHHTNPF